MRQPVPRRSGGSERCAVAVDVFQEGTERASHAPVAVPASDRRHPPSIARSGGVKEPARIALVAQDHAQQGAAPEASDYGRGRARRDRPVKLTALTATSANHPHHPTHLVPTVGPTPCARGT